MMKYNINNTKQTSIFRNFYKNYIKELGKYSKRIKNQPVTINEFYEIETNPLLERYFITNENQEPIGFCLLGFGQNTQPGTDWFIAEFYIEPNYRRKHYAENAISQHLTTHPGKYCYFVLKNNKNAQTFWLKMQKKHNCTDITFNYDARAYTPEDALFYAFEYVGIL